MYQRYAVTVPDRAEPGDTIQLLAEGRHHFVTVPARASAGSEFEVAVPQHGPSAQRSRPRCARLVCAAAGTPWLCGIWALVLLNYVLHVVLRPERWSACALVVAHALIFLCVASLLQFQLNRPGAPSDAWVRAAEAGTEEAEVCKRSGRLLPPRAGFVARSGEVVLGLDHFCWWTRSAVGHRNRKFFVLFLAYAALLTLCGLWHSLHDIVVGIPARHAATLAADPNARRRATFAAQLVDAVKLLSPLHVEIALLADTLNVVLTADTPAAGYALGMLLAAALDCCAALLLVPFAGYHLRLVARNRSSLGMEDGRYDVGCAANARQVLGRCVTLWALPVMGDGPDGDGVHWPVRVGAAGTSEGDAGSVT